MKFKRYTKFQPTTRNRIKKVSQNRNKAIQKKLNNTNSATCLELLIFYSVVAIFLIMLGLIFHG